MGMNLDGPIYLQRHGMLTKKRNRVLDIGPQTIYFVRDDQIREFVANQGEAAATSEEFEKEVARLIYFSTPRDGERTTMLSEITDLTNIVYDSIDVCPGLKNTEVLDLNFDGLPEKMRGNYDVVFNFGTTGHVVNQWNCFELMHDALKVGGVVYHQLPASGYLDHGYYCYTPLFFKELAAANGYAVEHMAVTPAGESRIDMLAVRSLQGDTLLKPPGPLGGNNRIPALNIHVIMRKKSDAAFRVLLEIATSHANAAEGVLQRYDRSRPAPRWNIVRSGVSNAVRRSLRADELRGKPDSRMRQLLPLIKKTIRRAGIGRINSWRSARATEMRELQAKYDECRATLSDVQSKASEYKQGYDGYRAAFETLQNEASGLRQRAEGYHAAYEDCCTQLAAARDERDRILRSVEKLGWAKSTLPRRLNGRQLCFLHLGKTAGTSLQNALFETMSDAAIFHDSIVSFDTVSPAEIAINDLVIGHYAFQHVAKLRADRFLFTFLRDPVDRVVSNYYFLRAGSPVSRYSAKALQAAKDMTLKEFCLCEDPGVRLVTENYQAKAIAFDVRPEYQGEIHDLAGQAEQNLRSFDFVGIVEYFSESVSALSEAIGLAIPIKRTNVTELRSREAPPSSEEVELIRRLNGVDIALYAKARELFECTVLRSAKVQMASAGVAQ